jgi:lipopolysaccharide/colanic/teichoic acid biosynthesis glycosyltransferase
MTPMAELTRERITRTSTSGRHLRLAEADVPVPRVMASEPARRALNVGVAVLGILATLPLWLLIALAIKLTSRGPVLYSQIRVGVDKRWTGLQPGDPRRRQDLGGRPFRIYKFRTMAVNAEAGTGAVWAQKHDCRVTPVGRILRQYRLDELPQLLNVLKGDMNVVGPRPERPTIFAELREKIPNYRVRQRAYPGITGHAQINLEYDSSVDDVRRKVQFDLEYIEQAGFWEDLKIMLKTIPVMLFRRGSR